MTSKLVYIGFKFSHMGSHSGYDQIKKYVHYDKIIDCQKDFDWLQKVLQRRHLLDKVYLRVLGDRLWWVEFYCALLSLTHKNMIFHFIYAENTFRYLGYFKRYTNKIVCTYHQPQDFFVSNHIFKKGIRQADKIICISPDMCAFFKKQRGPKFNSVEYIPHGVDTEYFKCNEGKKQKSILMVGNWLRDFEFANKVFQKILIERVDVKHINIVTLEANYKYFILDDRIKLMSGISDKKLLDLYTECSVLFLPLKKMTANNALLEGASCGCTIIIATDEKKDEYFSDSLVKIVPLDLETVCKHIYGYFDNNLNPSYTGIVDSVKSRYDWSVIGARTEKFLRSS